MIAHMAKPKIVLADDHRILIDAIKQLIEPEFDCIVGFDDSQQLLAEIGTLKPDVVILDVGMPKLNGFAAGVEIKKLLPRTRLIYLTMYCDRDSAAEAFKLGAHGYVLKSAAGKELIAAIREVLRGGYYASPVLTEGMVGSFVQNFRRMESRTGITPRQMEVLQLLGEGLSMKEVASSLQISSRTVAFHKYTIMERLELKTNAELLSYAFSKLPSPHVQ